MDTKSTQNKGLMSAYKNTLATTSSPNLKYNTVDTSKTQSPTTNNSPSQAEDSPRTRIRLTQTSKNIASLAKEGGTDSPEKKKSKDDSFIKESSTGIVKNNPSEPKQMSRATISISKKNHMDLMTNIKNMRAQSPTLQKDTPPTQQQEQDFSNEEESFLRRGRGPTTGAGTGGGRVARIFSNDELKHLKRAWTTSIAPPKDPSNIPSSNPASVHYSRSEPSSGASSLSLGSSRGKPGPVSRGTIDTSRNGMNLSVDSIVTSTNDKITLMIISSSSFASGLATSRIERLGSKVFYLLDVSKNGVKSGMLLRSYKHFQRFHQKVEMTFPSLFEEVRLPKKGINIMGNSDMKDTLIKDLQEYLNRITSIPEVIKSSPFISFLDPTEAPLLVYLTNPEKEGYLKVSRGIMQSLSWTEVWVVVKHKRLYIFLDNNASSLPITNFKLQYSSISFKTTKDVNQDTFEVKAFNRNKDYTFKVKDEQERNEWVTFLRNSKAKAIAESEASFDNSESFRNTLITNVAVSDVLVQYASGGGLPYSIDHKSIDMYNSIKNEASQLTYEEDGPSNIVFHGKKNTIKGATVEKLLEKLTEEEQDMDFVFAFLLTYRSFTTPSVLLYRCIQRFCSPPMKRNMTISAIHPTQLRVCTVLTKWVEVNFHEFVEDTALSSILIIFIETELVSQARFQVMGKKLKDLIRKKVNNERLTVNAELKLPTPELPPLFAANSFDVFDIAPIEIARQSTLLEFSLFKAVEPKECLGQKWNKKDQKDQAMHIMAVIKRFNQVSNWVVTKIVLTDDLKARVALLSRFIEIANACMQINNYNTAMEIIAGLNSSSVFRLKLTWEALSPSTLSTFNKIKEQLSHDGSYRNLRELLHNRQPPTIPYFGIYLTDLVFADEANPDKITDHGLINFEKNYLLYKIIKEIQLYQQTPYNFQAVPEIHDYLISAKFLDENETYELSLKCEPRDAS